VQETLQENYETAIMRVTSSWFPSSCKCIYPNKSGEKMKTLKAICAIFVLALSLSATTYGDPTNPGDGHSPGSAAPAPPPILSVETATSDTEDEGDPSLLTLGDVLWALASIY
jgi:hypothetical protein